MNLHVGRAMRIVFQTSPYLMYRAAVYGAICGVTAILLLFLALIGYVFGGGAAAVMLLIGLAAGGLGARLLREYILYLMRAGHVAVITEIIVRDKLPEGVSQTQWGSDKVKMYFKEITVLALIDQMIKGTIRILNRTLFNVLSILPIPGTDGAKKAIQKVVDFSLTYIDESILAYTFKTENENVYEAAQKGIILYCQAWKGLLKNAVALTVLCYAFTIGAALIFLIPLGALAFALPETWAVAKFALFLLALFLGFSLKWILFDPIACTATILTFLRETKDMTPDPAWEERIASVSDKFRDLKQKAASHLNGKGTPPTAPPDQATPDATEQEQPPPAEAVEEQPPPEPAEDTGNDAPAEDDNHEQP